MSKPLVSCLWGSGEPVNPPKLNIQEVQGALSSRPKGDQACYPFLFSGFYTFVTLHPCNSWRLESRGNIVFYIKLNFFMISARKVPILIFDGGSDGQANKWERLQSNHFMYRYTLFILSQILNRVRLL